MTSANNFLTMFKKLGVMLRRTSTFYIVIISCLGLSTNQVKSQIQIHLQQPPPNQFLVEDLWKVTIINPTQNSYSIYLTATATEATAGQILNATSQNFTIYPGKRYITSADVGNVNVHYLNEEIKNIIKKTGSVPSGFYTICVKAIQANTQEQIIGSTCIEQNVNHYTPPTIISPSDKAKVYEELPVFNWLPPTPIKTNQKVRYTIKIVEILYRQSAVDAMQSNPEWFNLTNVIAPIYQYNFASRSFVPGNRYAWKVLCYVNDFFINESVVSEFTYAITEPEKLKSAWFKQSRSNTNHEKSDYMVNPDDSIGNTNDLDLEDLTNGNDIILKIRRLHLSEGGNSAAGEFDINPYLLQKKSPNFSLSGSSRLEGQNANRKGTYQLSPARYGRWEFNPTLSVYKIPLSVNLFLSTEQIDTKQNINNIGIIFEPQSLLLDLKTKFTNDLLSDDKMKEYGALHGLVEDPQNVRDSLELKSLEKLNSISLDTIRKIDNLRKKLQEVENAKEKLRSLEKIKKDIEGLKNTSDLQTITNKLAQYNSITPLQNVLLSIRTFGIATSYPTYTNLTLSGVPVTGANLEMNPGLLYFAITGLNNNKAIQGSDSVLSVFSRKLFGTRIGMGKYDETHLFSSYLYGKDDPNSIRTDSTKTVTPMKDHLMGLEGKISILDNMLYLKGEITGSLFTRDVTAPEISNSAIPDFLKNTFGIKMSSSVDYAYLLNGTLNLDKYGTRVSLNMNMTGPGYISLGAPNIRNDNFGFDIRLDQLLLNKQISFSGYFRREKDNLIPWKSSTTVNTLSSFSLNLRFQNYPYLLLIISPNSQLNNQTADSLKVENNTTLMNISTGYGFRVFNLYAFTNLTYSQQSGRTHLNIGDYNTRNFVAFETISFKFPLSLSMGYSFTKTKSSDIITNLNSVDFSGGYTFFDKWQNSAGINYSKESAGNKKFGIYFSSSIPISSIGTFDLRLEKNLYKDLIASTNNYDEFLLRATLSSNW